MSDSSPICLAVDLGASSGRVVAGEFSDSRLALHEIHRFPNGGVHLGAHLHWDALRLWTDIQEGLRRASQTYGDRIATVSVDTWGVDFGLLGSDDQLLGNPLHYRDGHTAGILEKAFEVVPREEIFAATGLQFMAFNSLFQLWAMQQAGSSVLNAASSFLMMPDLIHFFLTGHKSNEETNASTTQFYDPRSRQWAYSLLDQFGLPADILGELTPPGTNLGQVRQAVASDCGLTNVDVILPGTHDTASAVAAVPVRSGSTPESGWCYISSGTWSLMGVETPQPIINDRVCELNFTNEGGVGGTTRLLKNIAGLWLLQECRRIWAREGRDYEWQHMIQLARDSAPLQHLIDPDHSDFVAPADMPTAIRGFCRRSGQAEPATDGAVIRCALESLAMRYRCVLEWLEELTASTIDTIHIVGGGAQNELLCQMAASACRRQVVAGPVEATAIGNLMMQAISLGQCGSIAAGREMVANSFDVQTFEPTETAPWDEAAELFTRICRPAN